MENQLTTQKSYLTGAELSAIDKLPESVKPFVEAKNSIKVALLEPQPARVEFMKLMVSCMNISGQDKKFHLDENQLITVSRFMYDFVMNRYKGMTLKEVENSFNLGVTGEYGDTVGFGVATLSKYVKGYMESQKRSTAMKEWLKAQDEPVTTNRPVTEFLKQNMDILLAFFEILNPENAKRIDNLLNVDDTIYHLPSIYDFMRKTFVIEFKPHQRETIIKSAKERYWHFIKKSGLPKHRQESYDMIVKSVKDYSNDDLMKVIDTYDTAGICITYDYHVKSEALKYVILGMKLKEKTLKDLQKITD